MIGQHGLDIERAEQARNYPLSRRLILIVVAALVPIALSSIVQARVAWQDARALALGQMRSSAWILAEGERDAFIVARYAIQSLGRSRSVQSMGADCSKTLRNGYDGAIGAVNFVRSDQSGQIRCSVLPFRDGVTFRNELWWRRAVTAGGTSLSEPIVGKISKKAVLIMAMPMRTASGKGYGLLSASISLDRLRNSIVRRGREDAGALIGIATRDGSIILSNNEERRNTLETLSKSNRPGSSVTVIDGQTWVFAKAPLFEKELSIIYAKPQEDLLAGPLWEIRQSILLPFFAIALASLAIWIGTDRLVVRWLRSLQALTAQLGRGEFSMSHRAFLGAPREITALRNELHAMASAISSRDAALNEALVIRTNLAREVNHRVKNNLQIVTSLLTLQSGYVADLYARDALSQARARIAALGLIHRVLYEHDAFSDDTTVNLRLLVRELCPQLRTTSRQKGHVKLECHCADLMLSVDQAVPVTLFVVEVVTNAFRHGFPDERPGQIHITVERAGTDVVLTVKDDGAGYAVADPIGKMGFDLMRAYASQLSGALDVDSTPAGTMVMLHFPLVQYT